MTINLVPVTGITSIYRGRGMHLVPVPERMAWATPDTFRALQRIRDDVADRGGEFRLSDLFRSAEMQDRAHKDYFEGRKTAYSPPSGQSWHETGRAFDVDMAALNMSVGEFRSICGRHGVNPIESESWHYECRGSHRIITDRLDYRAGVESALLAIGARVPRLGSRQREAWIQAALHRLGANPGALDGVIGTLTKRALVDVGCPLCGDAGLLVDDLGKKLRAQFPEEHSEKEDK